MQTRQGVQRLIKNELDVLFQQARRFAGVRVMMSSSFSGRMPSCVASRVSASASQTMGQSASANTRSSIVTSGVRPQPQPMHAASALSSVSRVMRAA